MTTTAMASTFKQELPSAAHCFMASQSGLTGAGVSGAFTLTGLSAGVVAALAVGMIASGTGVAAGAVVSRILSTTSVQVDTAHTGTVTSGTIGFTADPFLMLLIKSTATGAYDATLTNVGTPGSGTPSTSNVGTDEVTSTGYTSGGFALTNVSPALTTTTAYWGFSINPSWTGVTFSTISGVIYNNAKRLGFVAGRTVGNFDFAGTQTLSAATFTVNQPTLNSTTGLLRFG